MSDETTRHVFPIEMKIGIAPLEGVVSLRASNKTIIGTESESR